RHRATGRALRNGIPTTAGHQLPRKTGTTKCVRLGSRSEPRGARPGPYLQCAPCSGYPDAFRATLEQPWCASFSNGLVALLLKPTLRDGAMFLSGPVVLATYAAGDGIARRAN